MVAQAARRSQWQLGPIVHANSAPTPVKGVQSDTARQGCHGTRSENKQHGRAQRLRHRCKALFGSVTPSLLKPIHDTIREFTAVELSFGKRTGTPAHGDQRATIGGGTLKSVGETVGILGWN